MKRRFGGRSLALVTAVGLSFLATFALVSYVKGVEARTRSSEELVNAFVAKDFIPAGTSGENVISDGLVVREQVPRRLMPEGSVQSLDAIKDRVVSVDIYKGEQLFEGRFVLPTDSMGMVAIPEGQQAISVEVGAPPGVAGFVQPHARVSIIAQLEEPEPRAEFVLHNVQVLAVGPRGVDAAEAQVDSTQLEQKVLLTLAVTPDEAEKLAFAVSQGDIYFTLLPPESTTQANTSSAGS